MLIRRGATYAGAGMILLRHAYTLYFRSAAARSLTRLMISI